MRCRYRMVRFLAYLSNVRVLVEEVLERHQAVLDFGNRRNVVELFPDWYYILGKDDRHILFLLLADFQEAPREHLFEVLFADFRTYFRAKRYVHFTIVYRLGFRQLFVDVAMNSRARLVIRVLCQQNDEDFDYLNLDALIRLFQVAQNHRQILLANVLSRNMVYAFLEKLQRRIEGAPLCN